MKKTYEKPMIIFEDFSLSTSIAAGCEVINKNPSLADSCGYIPNDRWTGEPIFTTTISGCGSTQSGDFDGLCYHVPTEDNNLFNS